MAEPVLLALATEAKARWGLERVLVLHRTGALTLDGFRTALQTVVAAESARFLAARSGSSARMGMTAMS
jgi:molybdopterin synthase catalytic subunit